MCEASHIELQRLLIIVTALSLRQEQLSQVGEKLLDAVFFSPARVVYYEVSASLLPRLINALCKIRKAIRNERVKVQELTIEIVVSAD